jgi:threonylcarbamoyladenosine tRNA methylthiotransferase MtaB
LVSVAVTTLGCKVNQYESAGMAETLRDNGYRLVPFNEAADIYIINTCTVTGKADYQSRQLIRRAVRKNPRAAVLATGCYAQRAPEEIARIPGVTLVAGNVEKMHILSLLRSMAEGREKTLCSDISRAGGFSTPEAKFFPERTRALLKIQDGCDAYCSYCIVPYVRGRSRSLSVKEALERIAALDKAGYREAVLTGIHLGAYGRDLNPAADLLAILRQVEEKRLISRLRLSSLEPREISGDLLSLMKDATVLCRHFHIPLQSGDDGILQRMGRNYDRAFFKELVEDILSCLPDAGIGVDVMAGFPGEGEKEFAGTMQLIEELPVAYLHVFPYSPRPGTKAALLPAHASAADIKKRSGALRRLGREKRKAFAGRFLGKELTVLLEEGKDKASGWMQGFSENYIPVAVRDGKPFHVNHIVRVIAEDVKDGKLMGRIIHD